MRENIKTYSSGTLGYKLDELVQLVREGEQPTYPSSFGGVKLIFTGNLSESSILGLICG